MDNGSGQFSGGTQALLVSAFPVSFADGQAVEAEAMGMGLMPAEAACRDDGICTYDPDPGAGDGVAFADFGGEATPGDWRVCFGDAGQMDAGTVDRVALTLTKIM